MNESEYISEAIHSMDEPNPNNTTAIIKTGLEDYPNSAELSFLMAATLSETEDYSLAIDYYYKSIHKNPQLDVSRFQLGLLLATLERETESVDVLKPLCKVNENFYSRFSLTITSIFENDIEGACEHLSQGLLLNNENPSLNHDMKELLKRLENHIKDINEDVETEFVNKENESGEVKTSNSNAHLLDVYQVKH